MSSRGLSSLAACERCGITNKLGQLSANEFWCHSPMVLPTSRRLVGATDNHNEGSSSNSVREQTFPSGALSVECEQKALPALPGIMLILICNARSRYSTLMNVPSCPSPVLLSLESHSKVSSSVYFRTDKRPPINNISLFPFMLPRTEPHLLLHHNTSSPLLLFTTPQTQTLHQI